ncbi:MAG: hypothetical protein ACLQVL_07680 [Terriglobia bacterium]
MRELIPLQVFDSIQQHLRSAGESAVSGWERNSEEEDSLTGDLGRLLCTGSRVLVSVNGQTWEWRVSYKKFRGRGDGAFESKYGADGIIQIEVTLRGQTFFKGLLFQAKKGQTPRGSELREQVVKIEQIAPGGSGVVLFRPTGYLGIKGTEYLHSDEGVVGPVVNKMQSLASFLEDFLACKNGLRGMYFEAVRERLVLPTLDGEIKAIPLKVQHRIKIEVASS